MKRRARSATGRGARRAEVMPLTASLVVPALSIGGYRGDVR